MEQTNQKIEIGGKFSNGMEMRTNRSKTLAALLAIFLGGIGIHKFYLGRVGWGIVYLLFSWTGIPMVLGWIEGIIYFSMSDKAFETKYS